MAGRPPIYPEFTENDLEKIEKMAMYGLDQGKIADILGMSRRNFQNRVANKPGVKEAIHRGYAKAEAAVTQVAFEQAISGKNTAMTIFWLKVRAGWKETQVHEIKTTTIEDLVNGATEKEVSPKVLEMVKKDYSNE